jgi:SAM-dependent methyltransferase
MIEFLRALPPGAVVLDLGAAEGSFEWRDAGVIRVDLERPRRTDGTFVQADAARLPFRSHTIDLIVSNHSLEHFDDLAGALREIGRVLKPNAALYVAVPDASTFSDRLYRWLARGGGHVNAFRSADELRSMIQNATGLRCFAIRTLCSSLSCLNRVNHPSRAPRRLLLLGGGREFPLLLLTSVLRLWDRAFGTRFSVYGWAFYFSNTPVEIDRTTWSNVCIRCGSGHPSEWLRSEGRVRFQFYRCPTCGARNFFTDD